MVFNRELLLVLANHRCTLRFTEPHFDFVKLMLFTSILFIFDLKKISTCYYTVYPLLCCGKLRCINAFSPLPLSLAEWSCCTSRHWKPHGLKEKRDLVSLLCKSWRETIVLCCSNPGNYRDLHFSVQVCFADASPQIPLLKKVEST